MSKQNKFLLWIAVIVVISVIIGYSKRDNKEPVKNVAPTSSSEQRLVTPDSDVKEDIRHTEGTVDYPTFKQRFGIGALQHRSPFT